MYLIVFFYYSLFFLMQLTNCFYYRWCDEMYLIAEDIKLADLFILPLAPSVIQHNVQITLLYILNIFFPIKYCRIISMFFLQLFVLVFMHFVAWFDHHLSRVYWLISNHESNADQCTHYAKWSHWAMYHFLILFQISFYLNLAIWNEITKRWDDKLAFNNEKRC